MTAKSKKEAKRTVASVIRMGKWRGSGGKGGDNFHSTAENHIWFYPDSNVRSFGSLGELNPRVVRTPAHHFRCTDLMEGRRRNGIIYSGKLSGLLCVVCEISVRAVRSWWEVKEGGGRTTRGLFVLVALGKHVLSMTRAILLTSISDGDCSSGLLTVC